MLNTSDPMQLIIDTAQTSLSVRDKCFYIEKESLARKINPQRVSSIAIHTNCTLRANVIRLAAQHQIPLLFFHSLGKLQARLWSPYFANTAALRKKQLVFADSPQATLWVIRLLQVKTAEQIKNLRQLARRQPAQMTSVEESTERIQHSCDKMEQWAQLPPKEARHHLMGLEGAISRSYFQSLQLFMPPGFAFAKRSRRPALDPFNAALNYPTA